MYNISLVIQSAGFPNCPYELKRFYSLLIPDDADWITSKILYIYFNKLYC